MHVATATMNALLLKQSLRVQSDYNATLVQQSSGRKSPSLSGLDGNAGATVSLKSDLTASAHLVGQAQSAQTLVETGYGAISGLVDLVAAAKADIAAALSGAQDTTDGLKTRAEGWRHDVAATLNTEIGGVYVFGGAGAQQPPVDLNDPAYDPLADPTVPDGRYYQGNRSAPTLMIDGGNGGGDGLAYGVTAEEEAFETTLRALSMLAGMTTDPPDTAALQEAFDLLDGAATELGRLQETLSSQADRLSDLADRETAFQLYAESALESIETVDVAETTAKLAELELLLQASYSALSSLLSVSLVDHLR